MGWLQNLMGEGTESKEAAEMAKKASGLYDNIQAPTYDIPQYERVQDMGTYDPAMVNYEGADASLAGPTAMEGVSADPRLTDAQYASLGALDDIIKGGGLTASDKADLNKIQTDAAAGDRGRREAIMQNAASRGMSGSGNELLAALSSGQAATDRTSQAGLDVAGLAQQRALDAIMQSGQLAGNMRGQEFGEKSDVAKAKDAINTFNSGLTTQNNQFNAGNQLQAGSVNAGATNDARSYGVQNKQAVANANTGITNAQKDQPNAIKSQAFGDQTNLAQLKSGAAMTAAELKKKQADEKTRAAGNVASSAVKIGASFL